MVIIMSSNNNMKALQYESETTSPKDMHKGKERNEKNESVIISPPKGPQRDLCSLGWVGGHRPAPLGGGVSSKEVVGEILGTPNLLCFY